MRGRIAVPLLLACALFTGCARTTEHIAAVTPFDLNRYQGMWYEIARLPNRFEEGLTFVTAEYVPGPEGLVHVINRGYNHERDTWPVAKGIARFTGDDNVGEFTVTFRRPFSAPYRVIALDEKDYRYAMVTSKRMSYLWLLSRTPTLSQDATKELLGKASRWGFRVDRLIYVQQMDRPVPFVPRPPATESPSPKTPS